MWTTKTSKILLGGVNGQRNPGGGGPTRVTVTRRRRTKDTDANTTHTNKKKRLRVPRALVFARDHVAVNPTLIISSDKDSLY